MSHTRKVALVLVIAVSAFAGWQRGAANADPLAVGVPSVDLTATGSYKLVEGWCTEACNDACVDHEGCGQAWAIGCTCYWICQDGKNGETICVGAIGVKVCNVISRPSVASLIKPIDTM